MGVNDYLSSLSDNPYFGAGAGLFGVGIAAQVARKGGMILSTALKRKFVLTMEVPSTDKSFEWLMTWITAKGAQQTQHLSVQTLFQRSDVSGKVSTKFDFIPSPGIHIMLYKSHFIRVQRERENKMINFETGTPWETVTLSTLGTSRQLFVDMLEEARAFGLEGTQGLTRVYKPEGQPPEWRVTGQPMRPRPLHSVVLDAGVAEHLLEDVKEFIANSRWYQDRGIPYRRGYLLFGPPGCGKSSFITALAGELEHSICLLNLSMRGMNDDWLAKLMSEAPPESILLLEDVDAAFSSREAEDSMKFSGMSRLTLSGMLNALDGVMSSEGRILFMTTNYVDRLDPALIRPGRVDVKKEIGHVTESQLARMFARFYPDVDSDMAATFAQEALRTQSGISAAQVQALFMFYKENPDHAIKMAGIMHKL